MVAKIAVLIPAYNESKTIGEVVKRTRKAARGIEVLVVDDGSKDNTAGLAKKAGADVIRHEVNKGKAQAMITGMNKLKKFDWVVFLDADLQYEPEEIVKFLEVIKQDGADFILGYRTFSNIPHFRHWLANVLVSLIFNVCYGANVRDLTCGLRAIKMSLWNKMNLIFSGYLVETEMAYDAAKFNARIQQMRVGVKYHSKSGVSRGVKIVASILIHTLFWKVVGKRRIF